MEYNKLVRDKAPDVLKSQGFKNIKGKKLKGEKYNTELYSVFLQDYKDTLIAQKENQLQAQYADMLEIIRTLMISSKTDIKQVGIDKNQPLKWYKRCSPDKKKLTSSRIDLLQRFDELLQTKTEAIKDQLKDVFLSLKDVVENHGLSFAQVEQARRNLNRRLGGYTKGLFVTEISKTKQQTNTTAYSV